MKKLLAAALITVLSYGSSFGFGLSSLVSSGGGGSSSSPEAFLARAQAAEQLVNISAEQLFNLVASKEEQAKVEELKKKLAATTEAKEQKAITKEIVETATATLNKKVADKELETAAKAWDDKKKQQAGSALYNLSLGSLQAAALVPEGQNLASSIKTNPLLLAKASALLDAVKCLGGIGTGTAKVLSALPPVFSSAQIDAKLPTSATEKPRTVEL